MLMLVNKQIYGVTLRTPTTFHTTALAPTQAPMSIISTNLTTPFETTIRGKLGEKALLGGIQEHQNKVRSLGCHQYKFLTA